MDFDLALGAGEGKAASVFQEKEVLNVMDEVGSLWQISIEGSRVRVVNSTPLEVTALETISTQCTCSSCTHISHTHTHLQLPLNNPSGMSFKGDLMVAGDADGNITFLENLQSRYIHVHM